MTAKTTVLVGSATAPQDLQQIQVAIVTQGSWALIGRYYRHSGLTDFAPLPDLPSGTPLLETERVNDERMAAVMHQYVKPGGIEDLEGFLKAMQVIGAVLAYSV